MSRSKTPPCSRECGQRVWFDWSAKAGEPGRSDFGKLRPLQVSEDGQLLNEIHDCPNSDWNKKERTPEQARYSAVESSALQKTVLADMLGNTMDIVARIEKLDTTVNMIGTLDQQLSGKIDRLQHDFDELIPRFNQLVGMVTANQGNPLDDDGDSLREDPDSREHDTS